MKRLDLTQQQARAVRALLGGTATGSATQPQQPGGPPRLVVKILGNVAAGDYSQHSAAILSLSGSTISDTLQRILVRHVGEGAVTANTVVYPEQCGQLGLCYVRTSNGVPTYEMPIRRFARLVGPIPGELTGGDAENTDWTLGQAVPTNWLEDNTGGAFSGYHALFSLGSTPTTVSTGPQFPTIWRLRMKPLRYRVEVPTGPQWGANFSYLNARRQELSYAMSYPDEVRLAFGEIGLSDRTVKSGSWLHPMTLSGVQLPGAGIVSPSTLYGRFTEEKSGVTNRRYTITTTVARARLWVDGVDRTGIVPLNSTTGLVQRGVPGNTALGRLPFAGGLQDLMTFTPAALADKAVEFDLWVNIEVRHQGVAPGAGDFWGTPTRPVCWAMYDCRGMPAVLYSANLYQTLPAAKRWEFAFSSNGPGGVSTIRNEPTTGWTYSETTGGFVMSKTTSPTGFLSMNYLREIPLIEVRNGYNMNGLYVPDDDAHFSNLTFQNGQQWKPGNWNPNAATTFRLVGSNVNDYGVASMWLRALDASNVWSNLPETITVTPV
jgi:hypothetical protein